ncbi:MAG TPA: 3-deoxy-manno-octulosonate cytidylyltransferase [Nitrospinota bacterium]|nr:3-deoxy-manno-octulosonate cytidylyltransferase [Nitrospinota bacterium]|tara:strand:- start:114194 stop:114943 length:750 start_codon:yes stop_codon:yes gene_type:complete
MINGHGVLVVIPARYASSRLEGKPLKSIGPKTMIEHVYRQAEKMSTADRVLVATDDKRIEEEVRRFGGEALMTSMNHKSGTDRVAEVAARSSEGIIVNIQGDEPFIDSGAVDSAVTALSDASSVQVATLCVPISADQALNPDVTCVVRDLDGVALYFSKLPIPNDRDGDRPGRPLYKHLGIYVFWRDFLLKYATLVPTPLEEAEKLEQLRILEHGEKIIVVETENDSIGVDSPEDLERANELYKEIMNV